MTSNLNGFDITLPAIILEKWHRTNRYDALRYISNYYSVRNGSAAFETLQTPITHITVFYICIHKLITFVTLLHIITPQWPFASEFIREQSWRFVVAGGSDYLNSINFLWHNCDQTLGIVGISALELSRTEIFSRSKVLEPSLCFAFISCICNKSYVNISLQ